MRIDPVSFKWPDLAGKFCQSDSLRSIFNSPLCNPQLLPSHEVKVQSLPLCDAAPQTVKKSGLLLEEGFVCIVQIFLEAD